MGNSIVPSNGNPVTPVVGTRSGTWVWNGQMWVCDPDFDCPPTPCPPTFPFVPCPPGSPSFFPPPQGQPPWFPGANGAVTFSTTPPPNPVRGHFWWDGATLHIFDGAAFVTVGGAGSGGAVVSVTQPATPMIGQLWWNGTIMQVWDGAKWVNIATGSTGAGGSGAGTVVISATAPGNPVAGMQWWNGSVLQVFDGVAWKVVGPGAAAGPVPTTTLVFSITQPGYTTVGTSWGIFTFTATPQVDTLLGWNATTKQYTPKKAGIYLFEATGWESGGGGLAIVKNDPGTFGDTQNDLVVAIATSGSGSGHLDMSGISVMNGTTDFVRVFANSVGAQIWGGSAPPLLSATLLP